MPSWTCEEIDGLRGLLKQRDNVLLLSRPFSKDLLQFPAQDVTPQFKPEGLWYACGLNWIEYVCAEAPQFWGPYVYKLKLNKRGFLRLPTADSLDVFTRKYGPSGLWGGIDWARVAQEFSGIEICPYQWKRRRLSWYYPWDVGSGCFWDIRALQGIQEIEPEGHPP